MNLSRTAHSRALLEAAKEAMDKAGEEKRAAQQNVKILQEDLETAKMALAMAQSNYDEYAEKYAILLSLEDCSAGNQTQYPPAVGRLSAMNPHAANHLKSMGIDNSVSRWMSEKQQHRQSLGHPCTVAEENNEEERKRTQILSTARSKYNRSEGSVLDRSYHRRVQTFNKYVAIGEKPLLLQATTSSSSSCGNHLSRPMRWLSSFRRLDPRYQIYNFFQDVAQEGVDNIIKSKIKIFQQPALLKLLTRASAFSVWRPTSMDAIRKMMCGEATGKGLEIKGKSAKKGMLSSLVPFVQIHKEEHKECIREYVKDRTIRVFFTTEQARDDVVGFLDDVVEQMMFLVQDAKIMLLDPTTTPQEAELCIKNLQWDGVDLGVINIDEYSRQGVYGVEITERLFWEAFVMMQDCSRLPGSIHDIGRDSSPDYQDMNFKATRHYQCEPGDPLPVVWQIDPESPLSPRTLVMAYEMDGRVLPVVSDFDCFLVGTRGVKFDQPLPPDQVELVNWAISKIEEVLDASATGVGWVSCWLDVLKKEAIKGFYPKQPRFGYGDPKSYSLMECAVNRLQETGAVRHGAECFNYFFPQELDDEFLVICDTLPGGLPWKYVGVEELQKILIHKINDGHTFPLNPKWILCDPGWKKVYDALLASDRRNVQESLNVWFPPESGIREEIERVYAKHPRCFASIKGAEDSRDATELAKRELEKFVNREMGKRKLRAVIAMVSLANSLPSAKAKELLAIQTLGHSYRPPPPQSTARRLSRQVARARASLVAQQRSSQVATKEYSHTVRHHQRGCDHRDLNADSSGSDMHTGDDNDGIMSASNMNRQGQ